MQTASRGVMIGSALSLLFAAVPSEVAARLEDPEAVRPPLIDAVRKDDPLLIGSESFLSAHVDLLWRKRAWEYYAEGDLEKALEYFKRAAYYADKPSQGMVAEMLWNGEGIAQDRAAAYAWMDLAAERAFPTMLLQRERFWNALDAEERERALQVGEAIYAEYGDAVAQRRQARKMRMARMNSAGSRTGFVGALTIQLRVGSFGSHTVHGKDFYRDTYWDPDLYWAWQEREWKAPPTPEVDVGPLETR